MCDGAGHAYSVTRRLPNQSTRVSTYIGFALRFVLSLCNTRDINWGYVNDVKVTVCCEEENIGVG